MSTKAVATAEAPMTTRQWIAVFGAILGAFMAVLDIQITNASIREITGGLGATLDDATWISTSYLVAEIIVIPLTGYLSRVFSLRNYILGTATLFLCFSVCCALSWNLDFLYQLDSGRAPARGRFLRHRQRADEFFVDKKNRSLGRAHHGDRPFFAHHIS